MKKGFLMLILVMFVSLIVASLWDSVPAIKNAVNLVLNPTFGFLLQVNLHWGFIIITLFVTFITTLVQKYATDQDALKAIKDEQKAMQQEMKNYQNNPQKMLEFQKKQFEKIPETMELTMKPLLYTAIPFIILIRWFSDTFKNLNDPEFFGFMSWFWAYLLLAIIFSIILRKLLKVY